MDENRFGKRDGRGFYRPDKPAQTAPLFVLPPRPRAVLRWVPHYFFPYNVLFFLSALAWWHWIVPPVSKLETLSLDWCLWLLAVNIAAAFMWYAGFETRLYLRRDQGTRFKYVPRFPADQNRRGFWFGRQDRDNALRSLGIGVPIWTGFQIIALWGFANGIGPWLSWSDHPVYLAVLCLLVPVVHEAHFFCVHRLLHTKWLYARVHAVHHRATSPSPWSSLAMHPVEHLLYFSAVLYHLVLPSHPLIALYQLHVAGFGAVPGHVGFHKIELSANRAIDSHAYIHELHHRYFEVNYGDGLIPFDRWMGTFHDGSDAAHARMKHRLARKARKH